MDRSRATDLRGFLAFFRPLGRRSQRAGRDPLASRASAIAWAAPRTTAPAAVPTKSQTERRWRAANLLASSGDRPGSVRRISATARETPNWLIRQAVARTRGRTIVKRPWPSRIARIDSPTPEIAPTASSGCSSAPTSNPATAGSGTTRNATRVRAPKSAIAPIHAPSQSHRTARIEGRSAGPAGTRGDTTDDPRGPQAGCKAARCAA